MRLRANLGVMIFCGIWVLAACTAAVQSTPPAEGKPVSTEWAFDPTREPVPEDLTSPEIPQGAPRATPQASTAAPTQGLQFIEFYSPM